MRSREKITIRAVRVRYHEPALSADVLHGLGFRAECTCGKRCKVRSTWRLARTDALVHRSTHAAGTDVESVASPSPATAGSHEKEGAT